MQRFKEYFGKTKLTVANLLRGIAYGAAFLLALYVFSLAALVLYKVQRIYAPFFTFYVILKLD